MRNGKEQSWSVEIDGKSYNFVTIEEVKALVNRALASVEKSMTDAMRRPQ
jgi:guanylate kinase